MKSEAGIPRNQFVQGVDVVPTPNASDCGFERKLRPPLGDEGPEEDSALINVPLRLSMKREKVFAKANASMADRTSLTSRLGTS